jgi:hypothetical protein
MNKFKVLNCPAYASNGEYYDCWINQDTWCENIDSCIMKKIIKNLETVINEQLCYNCDGCGYDGGCGDTSCGTYQAYKSLELLNIKETEEK